MRQLRRSEHDVADGVDAGLGGLHPAVGLDESAVGLDLRSFQTDVLGARLAADGDQDSLGFDFLRFAVHAEVYGDPGLALFDFVDFGASVEVDAALAIDPRQLLGDFFVFDGNQARQHFDEGDFCAEGTEDGSEFDADRSRADNHQRLGNLLKRENLDVGQDADRRARGREAYELPNRCRELRFWL